MFLTINTSPKLKPGFKLWHKLDFDLKEKYSPPTACEPGRVYWGGWGGCWTVPGPAGLSTSMLTDEPAEVDPDGVAEYSSFGRPFSKLSPEKSGDNTQWIIPNYISYIETRINRGWIIRTPKESRADTKSLLGLNFWSQELARFISFSTSNSSVLYYNFFIL